MSTDRPTPSTSNTTPLRPLFYTLLIACPLLIILPPRKLDLYTFTLTGAWVFSFNGLASGRTRTGNTGVFGTAQVDAASGEQEGRLEVGKGDGGEGEGVKGLARKIWMGDERPGWQRRRLEREREELEAGKGYGDIIMEQVREVFPGFGGGRRGEDREGEKEE